VLSKHAEIERQEEDINIEEIETCIVNGAVLEDYAEDPRGHSCLLAGMVQGRWLHVVCGSKEDWVIIITVYIPKPPYWETPLSRGKR
jgi:hypothetical protein